MIRLRELKVIFDFDKVIVRYGLFFKKDAKLVLRLLENRGHNLKIVTSRGGGRCFSVKTLLWFHGIKIPVEKSGKNGNKADFAIGADFFVDDKVIHVEEVALVANNVYVFSKKKHDKFPTLSSWWDIYWEIFFLSIKEQ